VSRRLALGGPVIDQLPVYDLDGFTKKSGLDPATFLVELYRDGVGQGHPVTIAEIGTTGEYRTEFTPTAGGFWLLEVRVPYNGSAWMGQYDLDGDVEFHSSMADDNTDAAFSVWLNIAGQRATDVDQMTAQIRDPAGALVADLGVDSSPTADGVFHWTVSSSVLTQHVPYTLSVSATRAGATWYANRGFVRV